jgi:hypothetical protein
VEDKKSTYIAQKIIGVECQLLLQPTHTNIIGSYGSLKNIIASYGSLKNIITSYGLLCKLRKSNHFERLWQRQKMTIQ